MVNGGKITSFFDLDAWQSGHELAIAVYKLSRKFPKEEDFGLRSQVRRAAVSVTSNIAEGFSRDSYSDKCHFYVMSHASISELTSQFYLAKDLDYITSEDFSMLESMAEKTYKILGGLIRSTKERAR